jgi:predicted Zn-dependent protease
MWLQTHWRKCVTLLLALVVLCAALAFARPVYRKAKYYYATRQNEKAHLLWQHQDWAQAWQVLEKAYRLCPHHPDVNRSIASIYEATDLQRALPFWQATAQLSGKPDDYKALAQVALKLDAVLVAAQALQTLEQKGVSDGTTWFLSSQWYQRQGDTQQALYAIEQALASADASQVPPMAVWYANLLMQQQDPHQWAEAFRQLKTLARKLGDAAPAEALQVFRLLYELRAVAWQDSPDLQADWGQDRKEDLSWLAGQLGSHPEATALDKANALSLQLDYQDAKQVAAGLLKAEALFDPDEKAFWQWLNAQGLYAETLLRLSFDKSVTRQDWFLIWLDAMAAQGRWPELARVLEQPRLPLEPYWVHVFQARVYTHTAAPSRADLAWNRALMAAAPDVSKLWGLLHYAKTLQDDAKVQQSFKTLATYASERRSVYAQWALWEKSKRRTASMLQCLRTLYGLDPHNPAVRNDIAYAELLLGQRVPDNLELAKALVEAAPHVLAHRVTLSLAWLKSGYPLSALGVVLNLPINWLGASASFRVVAAAVLMSSGYVHDAQRMAQGLEPQSLLPEELELLEAYGLLPASQSSLGPNS